MARGIKDKVAILGMGVEAFEEALVDAGIDVSQLDAAWLGVVAVTEYRRN